MRAFGGRPGACQARFNDAAALQALGHNLREPGRLIADAEPDTMDLEEHALKHA